MELGVSRKYSFVLALISSIVIVACTENESFEDIGLNVASPIDIAAGESYFYVLNADISRKYNKGSILVVDTNGIKVASTVIPRVGHSISKSDDKLIVTIGETQQYSKSAQVQIFDISNPTKPTLSKSLDVGCKNPTGVAAPPSYDYFAISCTNGEIYIGTWGTTSVDTTVKLVRKPDNNLRRALHIDTARNLLFAFTTHWDNSAVYRDTVLDDEYTYDTNFNKTNSANEVADIWEGSEESAAASEIQKTQYQFLVYDISAEAVAGFPYLENYSDQAKQEMRWLYFNDTRQTNLGITEKQKYYRSNFWMTLPDKSDPNSFFISQRGIESNNFAPDSNAIYRFTISGDPRAVAGTVPETSSFLSVTTAYGHEIDQKTDVKAGSRFTNNFSITNIEGVDFLVVADFLDKSLNTSNAGDYFNKTHFGIGVKSTGDDTTVKSISSDSRDRSFFALGAIKSKVLTGSFYTDKLILLEVSSNSDIKEINVF